MSLPLCFSKNFIYFFFPCSDDGAVMLSIVSDATRTRNDWKKKSMENAKNQRAKILTYSIPRVKTTTRIIIEKEIVTQLDTSCKFMRRSFGSRKAINFEKTRIRIFSGVTWVAQYLHLSSHFNHLISVESRLCCMCDMKPTTVLLSSRYSTAILATSQANSLLSNPHKSCTLISILLHL